MGDVQISPFQEVSFEKTVGQVAWMVIPLILWWDILGRRCSLKNNASHNSVSSWHFLLFKFLLSLLFLQFEWFASTGIGPWHLWNGFPRSPLDLATLQRCPERKNMFITFRILNGNLQNEIYRFYTSKPSHLHTCTHYCWLFRNVQLTAHCSGAFATTAHREHVPGRHRAAMCDRCKTVGRVLRWLNSKWAKSRWACPTAKSIWNCQLVPLSGDD